MKERKCFEVEVWHEVPLETWLILLVILSTHMPRLSVFEGYHGNLNCMHSVSVEKAFPIVLHHNFFCQAESILVANL
jgi:hypothetical protein